MQRINIDSAISMCIIGFPKGSCCCADVITINFNGRVDTSLLCRPLKRERSLLPTVCACAKFPIELLKVYPECIIQTKNTIDNTKKS